MKNIRDARTERNFRRDYELALRNMPAGSIALSAKHDPGEPAAKDNPAAAGALFHDA